MIESLESNATKTRARPRRSARRALSILACLTAAIVSQSGCASIPPKPFACTDPDLSQYITWRARWDRGGSTPLVEVRLTQTNTYNGAFEFGDPIVSNATVEEISRRPGDISVIIAPHVEGHYAGFIAPFRCVNEKRSLTLQLDLRGEPRSGGYVPATPVRSGTATHVK